jgi:MoaE-MoaD fusion protein
MRRTLVLSLVSILVTTLLAGPALAGGKAKGKAKVCRSTVPYVLEGPALAVDTATGSVTMTVAGSNKHAAWLAGQEVTVMADATTKVVRDDVKVTLADLAADDGLAVKIRGCKGIDPGHPAARRPTHRRRLPACRGDARRGATDRRLRGTGKSSRRGRRTAPSFVGGTTRAPGYAAPVRVTVRLFAGLRERAGTAERELELPDGANVGDVWAALGLGEEPAGLLYAVEKEYAPRDRVLAGGEEVALIPPVSGGAFRLTEDPIDLQAVIDEVRDERAGAIATFLGTTRSASRGRDVLHLDYDAYAGMAEKVMAEIAAGVKAKYDLCEIAITHRVGRVAIGEASVAIAVSAPHRHDALAACREAIDTLKETVPLWKKEVYEGGEEWIARGS